MARLQLNPVSLERFTYLREKNMLVTEISELPRNAIGRLYDDACDEGIAVLSPRSGQVVTFALYNELTSGAGSDREVAGWVFKPVKPCPAYIAKLELRIYND